MYDLSGYPSPRRHAERALTIGCFAGLCRDRLGDALVAFSARHPGIEVGMKAMSRPELRIALRAGDIGLAIWPGDPDPAFVTQAVGRDRVVRLIATEMRADPMRCRPTLIAGSSAATDLHRFLSDRVADGGNAPAEFDDRGLDHIVDRVANDEGTTLLPAGQIPVGRTDIVVIDPGDASAFTVWAHHRAGDVEAELMAAILIEAGNAPDLQRMPPADAPLVEIVPVPCITSRIA